MCLCFPLHCAAGPLDSSAVARIDGQRVAQLDASGDGGGDVVGEPMEGGEGVFVRRGRGC